MIRPNYFFEYLLANLDIIDETKHNVATFCSELLAQGASGTNSVYYATNKKTTPYPNLTYKDLAKFAKDVYAIRYQQIQQDYPDNDLVNNPEWSPENISERDCFDMFFTNDQPTFWGFKNQSFPFLPMTEENKNDALAEQFVHFHPNGFPSKTEQADSRKITKRIYFNVSPQNALNITRELAQYASDTGEKVYCKFSTSAKRSDPILFYTNEEQLPRLLGFLDQLEAVHPEYLEPADCRQPFAAPIRPYCGLADEPEDIVVYSNNEVRTQKTSFNYEMSKALGKYLENTTNSIFENIDLKTTSFVVGKDARILNAQEYTEYLTWLNMGKTILKTQEMYKNANDSYGQTKKQLADELWGQYLEARANSKHYLANEIAKTSNTLYQGILNQKIPTVASISIHSQTDYNQLPLSNLDKWYAEKSVKDNGFWETRIDLGFNLYSELIQNLGLHGDLQATINTQNPDQFFQNIQDYMDEGKRSSVIPFLNTSTVANFYEYWQAKERGEITYSGSGIAPAEINSPKAPHIKQAVAKEVARTEPQAQKTESIETQR